MERHASDAAAAEAAAIREVQEKKRLTLLLNPDTEIGDEDAAKNFPMEMFPGFWQAHVDNDKDRGFASGRTFYFHPASKTSHWQRPTWALHRAMEAVGIGKRGRKSKLRESEVTGGEVALRKFEMAREKRREERKKQKHELDAYKSQEQPSVKVAVRTRTGAREKVGISKKQSLQNEDTRSEAEGVCLIASDAEITENQQTVAAAAGGIEPHVQTQF